jgi:hypothetical protein
MWTEVTKDLVIREAIDQMGYDCEETDEFFYVMEYLKYVRLAFLAKRLHTNAHLGGRSPACGLVRRNPPQAQASYRD